MRLHRLEVSAFGPFGDTVSLDFDPLGQAGLFLLTGNTGAGKTSLLDAVCFALYGQVPGDRQLAGRLRSDHAPPGAAPRVELEVTVGDRRFRFVRSPAWDRPKARGTGTTAQHATAAVAEWRGDGWEPLATRIPDVSQLAANVLGMDVHQFMQVVLLPQGRFQEFLRAGADTRKVVLERLFATSRFRDVERWLVARRQQTGRLHDQRRAGASKLVDQIVAVAGAEDPGQASSSWTAWAALVCSDLQQRAKVARATADDAHDRVRLLQANLAAAEAVVLLRDRGVAAQTAQSHQLRCNDDIDSCRQQLQRAERARDVAAVLPPLSRAEEGSTAAAGATAQAAVAARQAGLALLDDEADVRDQLETLDAARRRSESALASLSTLHEAARTRAKLAIEIEGLATSMATLGAARDATAADLAELPRHIQQLTDEVSQARASAARQELLGPQLLLAQSVVETVGALHEATAQLSEASTRRDALVAAHNDARDELNDLRDARLAGAAAWLAAELQSDHPCPVCGGIEHPSPAVGGGAVPTQTDEVVAHEAVRVAEAERAAAETELGQARELVIALESRAGGHDSGSAASTCESLRADLRVAASAAALVGPLEDSLHRLEGRASDARQHLTELDIEAAALGERLALRTAEHHELDLRIRTQLDPHVDLETEIARSERLLEAIDSLSSALRDLTAARQVAQTTRDHALAATVTAGFTTLDEVRDAALSDARRAQLRRRVDDHESAVRVTQATLADLSVQAAMQSSPPDLVAGRQALNAAEAAQRRALETAGQLSGRAGQAESLRAELATAMAAWAPARHAHEVAEAMATLAEGKAADNHRQISLSAYVLSARLAAVIDAANERLTPMTSGRYALEHTSDRTAGDRSRGAGGLGLRILDTWTGQSRDPKTLSGGETFQTSLALALGLADVVSSETGGAVMNSLFVDEGFGSLDSDSLDEVMDVLDGLRSGGRVVGVVSHVEALRERIPVQVRVVKERTGSAVLQP